MSAFVPLLTILEISATAAFALSGLLAAARKRMDVVGAVAVAFITAFGGGTLRDVLLDRRPLFWVEHQDYAILIFVLSLVAVLILRAAHHSFTEKAILVPDALGLGMFTVAGASQALELGIPLFIASLIGVITAVFGGVLRDIVCNEIPAVFSDRRPYAVCSLAGAWIFIGLQLSGAPALVSFSAGAGVASGLRLLAVFRGWRIPMLYR
jgi:uncharacterized membrane protein YeiH